jgi:hypothetical protein
MLHLLIVMEILFIELFPGYRFWVTCGRFPWKAPTMSLPQVRSQSFRQNAQRAVRLGHKRFLPNTRNSSLSHCKTRRDEVERLLSHSGAGEFKCWMQTGNNN